jgi:hypothetical protein
MNSNKQHISGLGTFKIDLLARQWGYDNAESCIEDYIFDSLVPSICMNPDCDYSTEYEPDQTRGFCECCGTNTVKSILILSGYI